MNMSRFGGPSHQNLEENVYARRRHTENGLSCRAELATGQSSSPSSPASRGDLKRAGKTLPRSSRAKFVYATLRQS